MYMYLRMEIVWFLLKYCVFNRQNIYYYTWIWDLKFHCWSFLKGLISIFCFKPLDLLIGPD